MKYLISVILSIILFFQLNAQNIDNTILKEENTDFNFYFGPHFSYLPVTNLNTVLKNINLSPFNNYSAGINVGCYFEKKRFALGADLTFASLLEYLFNNSNNSSNVFMEDIFFKYDIITKKNFCIYPAIGFGVTEISNKIFKDVNNNSFINISSITGNTLTIINQTPTINFSIAFEKYINGKKSQLAIYRIGFNYSPSSTTWHPPVGNYTNAPSDNISNIYFMIQVGGKTGFVKK